MLQRTTRAGLLLALLLGLAACDDPSGEAEQADPARLEVVSGGDQSGTAGAPLPQPLVVRVLDARGRTVEDVDVSFRVSGGGSVPVDVVETDAQGQAQTTWTLGPSLAQPQRVEARVATRGGASVLTAVFDAVVHPAAAATITVTAGEGQTGAVGSALPNAVVVRVTDAFGNPVGGANVQFAVVDGGGTIAPGAATSDASGLASATWTLGTRLDSTHVLIASVAGRADTVTATPALPTSARLTVVGGDDQQGTVGRTLADSLRVSLLLQDGRPVVGAPVEWTVFRGGGTLAPASRKTDGTGRSAVVWTLGTASGDQRATATVPGFSYASFRATAGAATPATLEVTGGGQTGAVGSPLPGPVSVRVLDAFGNGVAGVDVALAVVAGGGSVAPGRVAADATGSIRATWTLGTRLDVMHALVISVAGLAADTITATPAIPTSARLSVVDGDDQQGTVGTALAQPLRAALTLADGRPVVGAPVEWTIFGGGGTLTPPSGRTDAAGRTAAQWTLGRTPGDQRATATVPGFSFASFRASAEAAAPATVEITGGDAQTGAVGSTLPGLVGVRVRDGFGNPVAGAAVTFSVAAGGGSVSPQTGATDATGRIQAAWTLGMRLDVAHQLVATVGGVSATAAATPALPSSARLSIVGGDGQQATVARALADSLRVQVALEDGRRVIGVPVEWTVFSGGGALSPVTGRTGATGQTAAQWTLGNAAGDQRATATVPGFSFASFRAVATSAAVASLEIVSGNGQTATAGSSLAQLVVRARDASGNVVPGAVTVWAAQTDGGSLSPTSVATDAAGLARATWKLPFTVGTHTVTASVQAASNPSVTFSATATAPVPATLRKVGGDTQKGATGEPLASPLAVQVRNAANNAIRGVTVTWTAGAGGSVSPATSVTDEIGFARTTVTLPSTAGPYTVTASVTNLPPVSFTATAAAPTLNPVNDLPNETRVGQNRTVRVRYLNAYGQSAGAGRVRWRSMLGSTLTPAVSDIDPATGYASVTAYSTVAARDTLIATVEGTSHTAKVAFQWLPLAASVRMEVAPDTLVASGRLRYSVHSYDVYGNRNGGALGIQNLTPDILYFFPAPPEGWYATGTPGVGRLVFDGAAGSDTLVVIVRNSHPPAASVSLRPDTGSYTPGQPVTLRIGRPLTLRARARAATGELVPDGYQFTSSNPAVVAVVRFDGGAVHVWGMGAGSAQITARHEASGIAGTITINVPPR